MAVDLTIAGGTKVWDAQHLRALLTLVPDGYRIELEADDSVPTREFRVEVDHEAKLVRLTSWEVVRGKETP